MSTVFTEPRTIRVPMAGLKLAETPDIIETLLGSCVGIVVWDERLGWGGLAHAVLPEAEGRVTAPGKFVDTAILELKKRLLQKGARSCDLGAKVAGGATMFGKKTDTVGTRNAQAALHYLAQQKIPVVAQHLGGDRGRVIRFSLNDWSVQVEMARKVVAVI